MHQYEAVVLDKLTIDQKLQIARMATDITIKSIENNKITKCYHSSLQPESTYMDIYSTVYTQIIKTIMTESGNT